MEPLISIVGALVFADGEIDELVCTVELDCPC